MKNLIILTILALPLFGMGQDTTRPTSITKIFKDVYGNWYDTKGVVETDIVQPRAKGVAANQWVSISADSTYKFEYRRIEIQKPIIFTSTSFSIDSMWITGGTITYGKPRKKKTTKRKRPAYTSTTYTGGVDIVVYAAMDVADNGTPYSRAYLSTDNGKVRLKYRNVGGWIEFYINNKWIRL